MFVGRLVVKHGANDLSKKSQLLRAPFGATGAWCSWHSLQQAQQPLPGVARVTAVWQCGVGGFSINGGTPIAGWFARDNPMKFHEHPMKMHDLGVFLV